ncbi:MAG: hypothetical protein CMLOHMNK_00348 [Steroidobacteraceae bacterium]|nr:hypothetical protein [Steroidobacteraceae bacterium]
MRRVILARKPMLIALCAVGIGGVAPAASPTASGAPAAAFRVVSPCPFPTGAVPESRLTCGFLDVPESAAHPSARRLRIPVARIRASGPAPRPDPVVFLHGGPGTGPLGLTGHTVERFAAHPFAVDRDIILFNQRGSPATDPPLSCAALDAGRIGIYADDIDLGVRDARITAAAVGCLEEIAAAGRDLAAYSATAAAADLEALRLALGIERWNLLAVSYGTLIALEAARVDGAGVRSLVLDSVVSPGSDLFMSEGPRNFSWGIDRLLAGCEADASCAADFPDVAGQLRSVIESLRARPVKVTVAGPGGEGSIELTVNWHDFLGAIHWMLYNAKSLRLVPLLVASTHRGDLRVLTYVMDHVFPAPRNGAGGASPAFFAFVCRDQFTRDVPRPPAASNPAWRGFSIVSFVDEVCAQVVKDRASRLPPLKSAVPALLFSGRFDPMTPGIYAREVAAGLPSATLVEVGDSGHSTLSAFDSCQTRLAVEFLATLRPPTACRPQEARPVFVRSYSGNTIVRRPSTMMR